MSRYQFLVAVALVAGCRSYEMKTPDNFDPEPVALSGKLGALRIGEFQLSKFERSWTKGSGLQIMTVKSEKRRQQYRFHLAAGAASAADTHCEFATRERTVGLKGGWEIMAGAGASLNCKVRRGENESVLTLSTASEAVLSGDYQAGRAYRIQGVGLAAFTGGSKGPAAGFHIFEGDRAVAAVQIVGPRRVLFARAIDATQRAELAPAIAALLLLDESLREF